MQGTLKVSGGMFKLSGGEFISSSAVNISGGAIIVDALTANPLTFAYTGLPTMTLDVREAGISEGQVHLVRSTSSDTADVISPQGFNNNGVIRLAATSSRGASLSVNGGVTNLATGLIHFQSGGTGTRRFAGDLANAGGLIQIDASATFSKSGAIFQQLGGTINLNNALSFSGAAQINLTGGELNLNGSITGAKIVHDGGTVNYTSGIVSGGGGYNYLSGTINGTVPLVGSSLTVGTGIREPFSFSMARSGMLTLADGIFRTGQQLTFESDSIPTTITSSNGFTNEGTVSWSKRTSPPQITFSITSGTLTNTPTGVLEFKVPNASQVFSGSLVNHGQLTVESNTSFTRPNSVVTNYGNITIASGAAWSMHFSITFEQTNDNMLINGTYNSLNPKRFTGGRLFGKGKIAFVENVAATVEPGDAVGTLTVQANYRQRSAGRLLLELGGKQTGQFDVLSVAGTATIAGTLEVQLVDSGAGVYSPSAGDAFAILTTTGGIIWSIRQPGAAIARRRTFLENT